MKKILIALTVGVALTSAQATLFYTDTFSYTDGSLVGNSGGLWATHSGTAGQMQVTGGQAVVAGANSEDVHRDTGSTMGAGDTWYAGFDVSVSGGAGTVYFAHFLQGTSIFGGRIFVAPPTAGGDFKFGLSGTSTIDQSWASGGTFGTSYRLVVSYDYNTGAAKLWVNPTLETDTALTSVNGFASDAMTAFAFRESSNSSTEMIDNLRVGTSFQEALTGVPEPTTLSLAALGGLALLRLKARKS